MRDMTNHKRAVKSVIRDLAKEGYTQRKWYNEDTGKWNPIEKESDLIDEIFSVDETTVKFINPNKTYIQKPSTLVIWFNLYNAAFEVVADAGYNDPDVPMMIDRVTTELERKYDT